MNDKSPDRVFIFDTTLRDGEQSPGFHLDANSKLRIARQLEKLGVDVIEAGFPISSPGDFEACRRVAREIRGATVTALARAVREDIDAVWGAIKEAESPQIHIVLSVSDVHIDRKLGMTRAQVLKRGAEMVSYARSLCDRVQYSPEDAGRSDPDYLVETVETMIAAGANVINIPDTTGYCLPWEFGEIVRRAITEARGSEKALFSVHCHNDLGLAVANTLAALAAGARRVECTINGIGERAGNTSLEEIVMLLNVRHAKLGLECAVDTKEITRASRLVAELTGTPVQPNKAVVGANAFSHASGIHQDGVLKDRLNYEIMKPEDVGLSDSRIVLTARSGRHAFHHRLDRLGIMLEDGQVDAAWQRFLQVADTKQEVTDEDLRKIAAAAADPNGHEANGNGHETNGHPPVTDQLLDHNHVADTLRHLIFG
ncbi:MAG TPA: 2-isopropylmalate synthase [Candidatus Angelobacter sp.]|nr:2-isopropylmalate synthase [Candidatus Angelobacter sp.]